MQGGAFPLFVHIFDKMPFKHNLTHTYRTRSIQRSFLKRRTRRIYYRSNNIPYSTFKITRQHFCLTVFDLNVVVGVNQMFDRLSLFLKQGLVVFGLDELVPADHAHQSNKKQVRSYAWNKQTDKKSLKLAMLTDVQVSLDTSQKSIFIEIYKLIHCKINSGGYQSVITSSIDLR